MDWTYRAKTEIAMWPRTWFGTLTLRPERQFYYLAVARSKCDAQGVDFDQLEPNERLRLHHQEVEKEITKYLKRVRKQTGTKLRYLLVCEAHTKALSGMPHYHMFVHECGNLGDLKYRILTAQWTEGFSKFRLVRDVHQATYVCKYISKSTVARVRASVRYGLKDISPLRGSEQKRT